MTAHFLDIWVNFYIIAFFYYLCMQIINYHYA